MLYPTVPTLASDNFSGIHPEVFSALQQANIGHAQAYGNDPWTNRAEEIFRQTFGNVAEAFIVFNGTGANVTSLNHLLSSWQAIICPDTAHIRTDECGAPQANSGCSLLTVPTNDGKLSPDMISQFIHLRGVQHNVQPAAVCVSQTTEFGTIYSPDELRKLADTAHQHGLLFFLDGARLANAAASLGVSLKAITTDVGVDVLSFGGTKNGLMGAEAVVFLKPGLADNFAYVRKQRLQLASKMRFLAAQFIALLEGDLWKRNASHANAMAKRLETALRQDYPDVRILYPSDANVLFVQLPLFLLERLQKMHYFLIWNKEKGIARWMTSWDTQPEFIDQFVSDLKSIL